MCFFFFKQKTAYEMRISDWSSDVCSSDLVEHVDRMHAHQHRLGAADVALPQRDMLGVVQGVHIERHVERAAVAAGEAALQAALDEMVVAPAIGDEVGACRHLEEIGRASGGERVC